VAKANALVAWMEFDLGLRDESGASNNDGSLAQHCAVYVFPSPDHQHCSGPEVARIQVNSVFHATQHAGEEQEGGGEQVQLLVDVRHHKM